MKWDGAVPTTDTHYAQLKSPLREQGHLLENQANSLRNMGRHPGATYHTGADTSTDTEHAAFHFSPFPSVFSAAMADGIAASLPWNTDCSTGYGSEASSSFPVLDAEVDQLIYNCEHCSATAYSLTEAGFDSDTDNDECYDEKDDAYETYLAAKTEQEAAEGLFQAYLVARRRRRKFAGRSSRATRYGQRVGRSMGKGRGKGRRFLCQPRACWEDAHETFYKGRGKKGGGKGKGKCYSSGNSKGFSSSGADAGPFSGAKRKNPIGKDCEIMTCSGCGSDEHFVKECPQRSGGSAKGGTGFKGVMHADQHAFGGSTTAGTSSLTSTAAPTTAATSSSEGWQLCVGMEQPGVHLDMNTHPKYMTTTLNHDATEFVPQRAHHPQHDPPHRHREHGHQDH